MRKVWLPVLAIGVLCLGSLGILWALLPRIIQIANPATPGPDNLPTLPPAPLPTLPTLPTPTAEPATVTAAGLHVRSGPGIAYPVIGWLHEHDRVMVLGCRSGWARLANGYVNSVYLSDKCGGTHETEKRYR